ncbi:MAG: HAD family hydrolase [Clostridiales bacterium]|nr:HAD family hydrolase [Clostridiales bacterium]
MQKPIDLPLRQVLWDWNGTLLDDLWYAIGVRNRTFPAFGLPTIDSLERYYQEFTFPVKLYYERAGVTDENFTKVAHAWMDEYVRGCREIPLHADAVETVRRLQTAGLRQVVLSASKMDILTAQLSYYPELEGQFDRILALSDIYARSKEAIGCAYLRECGVPARETVMIGDTLHDADVARAMGTQCILVARGHQSRETLETAGAKVVESLAEAAGLILGD